MKTSVKVATVLLYLLCFAALFMPYHIDALSQQPISGIDLMFGYSIHENPIKGEWIFRRVLEGAGVQDIFIFPSRATKDKQPLPDG